MAESSLARLAEVAAVMRACGATDAAWDSNGNLLGVTLGPPPVSEPAQDADDKPRKLTEAEKEKRRTDGLLGGSSRLRAVTREPR